MRPCRDWRDAPTMCSPVRCGGANRAPPPDNYGLNAFSAFWKLPIE